MQTRKLMAVVLGSFLVLLSTSSHAWSFNQNFDSSEVGSSCKPLWENSSDSTVSSDMGASGSQSCKMAIKEGGHTWGGGIWFPKSLVAGDQLWIRFRTFAPAGFSTFVPSSGGSKLKFIRVSEKASDGKIGRLDWEWPNTVGLEHSGYWMYPSSGYNMTNGVWETWEMYVKFDKKSVDNGGTGRVRLWKNGVLFGDLTANPGLWWNAAKVVDVRIFDHWNGGAPKTQHLYLDDLVVTNQIPSATDADGNPYIGMGGFVAVFPPKHPNSVSGTSSVSVP